VANTEGPLNCLCMPTKWVSIQGAVKNMLNDDDIKDDVCESCKATTISIASIRFHSLYSMTPRHIFHEDGASSGEHAVQDPEKSTNLSLCLNELGVNVNSCYIKLIVPNLRMRSQMAG
jgi:hypothetical protein